MTTIYVPQTRADVEALNTAADRGAVRRVAWGIYSDDSTSSPDDLVREHLLAILGACYPESFVSHSTAALLRPRDGVAFLSGAARAATVRRLPGVVIKRVRAVPSPEIVTVELETLIAPRLSAEPVPARVRMSSPLQAAVEVLSRDARQPERSLPDETVRALIDALPGTDLRRARAFAHRNGLRRQLARFEALVEGLRSARATPVRRAVGLDVYLYHWRVGRLEALAHGEFRFAYDDAWPIPLSGLPRDSEPAFEGKPLPAFFENLLPEGWAEARLRAVHKIARDDLFGLLATTQKYLSNLTLRPDGFDASQLVLDHLDVRLSEIAPRPEQVVPVLETIGQDPDSRRLWLELRRRGAMRLSGVQAKLPVHVERSPHGIRLAIGDLRTTGTHILKLPSTEFAQLVENEWAVMELARRVGLDVPAVRKVRFEEGSPLPSPALLVERFDLPTALDSGSDVFLVEDAASLLGLRREDKYRPSLERVADALRAAGLTTAELGTFLDHVVFSWRVGNGDLHAKNISVLYPVASGRFGAAPSVRAARYSPLYDLVSTRVVLPHDVFALPVNGRRNGLRVRDFAALAGRWGWAEERVSARVGDLGARIQAELPGVLSASGLTEALQERLAKAVRANLPR